MKSIPKLIKNLSFDVLGIYKNFVHWNISKVIISLATILLGFIMALPFVIILVIIYFSFDLNSYLDSIQVNILSLLAFMGENPFVFILFMIFSLLAGLTMLFGYSYRKILFTKLNLAYLEGEKLPYKNKYYFDIKLIWKYIGIISWVSLFVAIPIIVFLFIFFVLFFSFGGSEGVQTIINSSKFNPFTISTFVLFIVCLLAFVYISYRLFFSVIIMADDKDFDEKKALFFVKESFFATKKINTALRFVLVIIISFIFILPLGVLNDYFSPSLQDVRNYMSYKSISNEQKVTLDEGANSYYINKLKLEYGNTSLVELQKLENYYFYINYFLMILNFLIVFGLFEMIIVSFYKHEIKHKKSILSSLIGE